MAVAGAEARAEIIAKVEMEPEPKINNFGSATLVVKTLSYTVVGP